MIKSEIVKIKYTNDNLEIESELKKMGIEPLRWAIVAIENDKLILSVSFKENKGNFYS